MLQFSEKKCNPVFSELHNRSLIVKQENVSVVLKVVHPGIKRQVEIDLLLMKAGSWVLHCLPGFKWLSLCEIVAEFEKLMSKQVKLSPHT